MSQRQSKKVRIERRKMEKETAEMRRRLDYLERRPPMWNIPAYIKWRREGLK